MKERFEGIADYYLTTNYLRLVLKNRLIYYSINK